MTGYAEYTATVEALPIYMTVRSVNHKFGDYIIRLPRDWAILEEDIRRRMQARMPRGRLELTISLRSETGAQDGVMKVDWVKVEQYRQCAEELSQRLSLSDPLHIRDWLQLPGVLTTQEGSSIDMETVKAAIMLHLENLLDRLLVARKKEGEALRICLREQVRQLGDFRRQIILLVPQAMERVRSRLRSRVTELLDGDASREHYFAMEVALMAERSAIDEELDRLNSHLAQFTDLLEVDEPVGKKLDFVSQEILREVNTIGSKASDAQIAQLVIAMKAEIDKIREQMMNVQ